MKTKSTIARRYLVTLTEHASWEIELEASSRDAAIARAGALRAQRGHGDFSSVERDSTDWNAVPLAPADTSISALADAERAPHEADALPPPRYFSSGELKTIVKLLREVREHTLSRRSLEESRRAIELITGSG